MSPIPAGATRRLTRIFLNETAPASGVAGTFRRSIKGYSGADLKADLLAGFLVAIIALPLSMALAIAAGVPPHYGLYTAIFAAPAVALLGGTRIGVTGPTAAFVVLLAPISAKYGIGGLTIATMMAGALLIGMSLFRLGRLITYIPHPVTTGFTAGIGIMIATLQVKDFLGLDLGGVKFLPPGFVEKLKVLGTNFHTASLPDITMGLLTLGLLLGIPKVTRKFPAPLLAISIAAITAALINHFAGGFHIKTIGESFPYVLADGTQGSGIPSVFPAIGLPWNLPGPGGEGTFLSIFTGADGVVNGEMLSAALREIGMAALAMAMLGAIVSLLCAVVADGMSGQRHNPDAELLGQGAGNVIAPLFGGIAGAGAVARTTANIRAGARTPLSSVFHSVFVLLAVVAAGPLLGYLPMSALAALLLMVAWNMTDFRMIWATVRTVPADGAVLFTCLLLTVMVDMVVAVGVGVVLAALIFMRRMTDLTDAHVVSHRSHPELHDVPDDVVVYEVAGPMFFGAASKAMSQLPTPGSARAVILQLQDVPTMDITGLVALRNAVERLRRSGVIVMAFGVRPPVHATLSKAGLLAPTGPVRVMPGLHEALEVLDHETRVNRVETIRVRSDRLPKV